MPTCHKHMTKYIVTTHITHHTESKMERNRVAWVAFRNGIPTGSLCLGHFPYSSIVSIVYNKQDIPIKQMQRASKAEGKLFPIRERVSKTPRSEKTADAAKSKPWRDGNNRFTVPTGGIIKSSYIEFQIRRTRKSPALRFNIGETVILRRGAMEFRATVYSFTPRSLSGSDICASGTLRIHHQSEIAWELQHNSM